MCFSVEPKAKYYYQEEIIPARPHRGSSYRDSYGGSGVQYYHHHDRHHSSSSRRSSLPRSSYITQYSPRASTYISTSSTSSNVVPARAVYRQTTTTRSPYV
ncbi:hypothetical protein ACQKWADRAFT_34195 [Trichoderma austrokoningii]